ncbi:MAG: carboxypeptidase regulatory-like domain-containing protein, partial [Acidobacteria bacterium]|nr:carboxypeptidase regulatory-like domain-containing protein [Acidobacteriota bacterium]
MRVSLKTVILMLPLLLAMATEGALVAHGQTTLSRGALEGEVLSEADGKPIRGAIVTIRNLINNSVEARETDERGRYRFSQLDPGLYDISVTCQGYEVIATSYRKEFPVEFKWTGVVTAPPLILRQPQAVPASGSQRPLVSVLKWRDGTRGSGFDADAIKSLPMAGLRTFDQLAFLAAGVLPPPEAIGSTLGPGIGAGVGTAGQVSVNGLRSRGNNFTVDSSDNNDEDVGVRRQGFTALIPQSIESVNEVKVTTALAGPQFGRGLGGQIDAVSLYGGSRPRGELYGFYTDRNLQARDPFDLTRKDAPAAYPLTKCVPPAQFCEGGTPITLDGVPLVARNPVGDENPLTLAQFGAVVSGPLTSRGASFLSSLEWRLLHASRESNFSVPTVSQRGLFNSGDEGLIVRAGGSDIGAYPTTEIGDRFYSLFPFPNNPRGPYGDNTFTRILPADARGVIGSVRVDDKVTLAGIEQKIAARYNITDDQTLLPVTGESLFSSLRAKVRTQNLSLVMAGELSRRTGHDLRFSYGRTRLDFDEFRAPYSDLLLPSKLRSNGTAIPFLLNSRLVSNYAFPNDLPKYETLAGKDSEGVIADGDGTGPLGQMIVSGFSPLGVDVNNFPQRRANNTFQIGETINHSLRRHGIVWGGELRRVQLNSRLDRGFRPLVRFSSTANLSRLVDPANSNPLLDRIFQGSDMVALGAPTSFSQTLAFNPDSTIGLRLWQSSLFFQDNIEIAPGFRLVLGLRYELNSVPREVDDRIEKTFDSQEVGQIVAAEKERDGASGFETYLAGRKGIYAADRNNLAPYVAFAWDPFRTGRTAVRGGYGRYFDQVPGVVISQSRSVFPTFLTL